MLRNPDREPAGGFHGENFGGNHVRELFIVLGLPHGLSLFKRAALIARVYDDKDGTVTLAETEWRD